MTDPLLRVEGITARHGGIPVLHGVSLTISQGETVCVLGANGAGKSTILRTVMGSHRLESGRILFYREEIQRLRTEEIVRRGIVYVPEGKMLFGPLPVEENLLLGAYTLKDEKAIRRNLDFVYGLFPRLRERKHQAATTLSGGEQQMVAIGRGLMSNPQLLMLDEPSLGLAPLLVDEVLDTVHGLKKKGMTILLVEQSVREALDLADRGYVLQTGRITAEGTGRELLKSDIFRSAFLGI